MAAKIYKIIKQMVAPLKNFIIINYNFTTLNQKIMSETAAPAATDTPKEGHEFVQEKMSQEAFDELVKPITDSIQKAQTVRKYNEGKMTVRVEKPIAAPGAPTPDPKEIKDPKNISTPSADTTLQYLNEVSGKQYNSVDEWKEDYSNRTKSLATLGAEREELSKQLELERNTKSNPFANEKIAKMNSFAKNFPELGIEVFNKVSSLTDKSTDMDVAKLYFGLEHPEYEGDETLIEARLEKVYSDLTSDDATAKRLAEIELKGYANKGKAVFNEMMTKSQPEVLFPDAAKIKEAKQALNNSWDKEIDGFSAEDHTLTFTHEWANDKAEKQVSEYSFKITKGELASIKKDALEYIVNTGQPPTPENVAMAKSITVAMWKQKNEGRIVSNIVTAAKAEAILDYQKKSNNPPPAGGKEGEPKGDTRTESQKKADRLKESPLVKSAGY